MMRSVRLTLAILVLASAAYATAWLSPSSAETWAVGAGVAGSSRNECVHILGADLPPGIDGIKPYYATPALTIAAVKAGEIQLALSGLMDADPNTPFAIAGVPFAFRDAAHVTAFARSALFRETADAEAKRTGVRVLALTYGAPFVLLSRSAVFSEPEHVGETLAETSRVAKMATIIDMLGSAAWAPLLGAQEVPLLLGARLAALRSNVIDAAVVPISFSPAQIGDVKFLHLPPVATSLSAFVMRAQTWDAMPAARRETLQRWLERASLNCSQRNFDQAENLFRSVTARQVQPVAMNVAAFQSVLVPKLLIRPNNPWTRAQWDRLQAIR